ncbi:MAG: PLP-dependent aspartate aminotransferase family protein [Fimbriimonadaceae bacterium]|nr:PLP-dependent aspartate aminotransferase family protein [Fimbriimonadaceae bacterium]
MPEPSHHDVDTMLQHLGEEEHVLGAVTPPIFQTSLFVFETCDEFAASFTIGTEEKRRANYSRIGNPTVHVVNEKIAALEHCDEGMVFGSGMAAISAAILSEVEAGAHIVAVDTCYGPTKQFITEYLPRFGVSHTLVEGSDPDEILAACKAETKLIYLESPSSIIFRIQDLETVCRAAKERGITTAIDNSYASPIFQTPHDFGVDIILHSATKYLAGHSDVVAGALATDRARMDRIMKGEVALLGAILPPFPAWLLLRGMRTLPVRLRAVQETGNAVAAWLGERPEAAQVFHVGSAKHPQRGLIDKQMRGSTGLLSFEPRCQDFDKLKVFADSLALYQMGVSWGGHESLCVPLTYHPLGWQEQRWLVRLYNGLESPRDLIADLEQAFAKAGL